MKKTVSILFLILISCNNEINQKERELKCNLKENEKISIFNIFSKIEVIPLETNEESLINNIFKVINHNDFFYILDLNQSIILKFDKNGKYKHRIGNIGDGPEEYFNITDFDIDTENNIVNILSGTNTIFSYDLSGKFIKRYNIKTEDIHFTSLVSTREENILLWSSDHSSKKQIYLYSKENGKIEKSFYEEKFELNTFARKVFHKYNNDIYFSKTFSNQVYKYEENEFKNHYEWDFGENTINLKKIKSEISQLNRSNTHRKIMELLKDSKLPYFFNENHQNRNFFYTLLVFNIEKRKHIFYDKTNNKSTIFEKFSEGVNFYPLEWTDNYIIGTGSKESKNTTVNKNILDEENNRIYNNIKEFDNPFIIKYHFK